MVKLMMVYLTLIPTPFSKQQPSEPALMATTTIVRTEPLISKVGLKALKTSKPPLRQDSKNTMLKRAQS
jgi:hypothetical protein